MTKKKDVEVEVKFAVPNQNVFASLITAPQLADFKLDSMGKKVTTDHYWDTSEKDIMQAGYACRLRTINGQHILTLKSLVPPEGTVHRRQEIETEVSSEQPELWPDSKAKSLILSLTNQEPLEIMFTIHQTRYVYHVVANNTPVIELSLDEVSLGASSRVDFFEVEAELLEAGTEADLTKLTDILQKQWPLQPETRSKFERAMAQISG